MENPSELVLLGDDFLLVEESQSNFLFVLAFFFFLPRSAPNRENLLATATQGEMQKAHPLGRKAASGFTEPIYNKLCLLLSSK